ncbi:MAG: hypothetical protein KDD55_01625 [Bdellovibrionales bacterium]|nr:hypothetical protein [Bdellovibrionales bacterium]
MGWPRLRQIDPLLQELLYEANFDALVSEPDVSLLIAVLDQAFMDIRYHKHPSYRAMIGESGPRALAWMREQNEGAPPFLSFESICEVLGLCPQKTLEKATALFFKQQALLKELGLLAA